MAIDFEETVFRMAKAKRLLEIAEDEVEGRRRDLENALESLEKRVRQILDNRLEDGSFEVSFLDTGLAAVNEADRRYEVAHTSMIGLRNKAKLLEEFVESLKEDR